MKKQCCFFILTLILFVIPFVSKGQASNEDVIYFKNGNIVYGHITEKIIGQSVTIKTDDGNILTSNWNQVYKIISVPSYLPRKTDTAFYASGTKISGFLNITELSGGMALRTSYGDLAYGVHTIFGYLISPEFSVGVGIGYEKCSSFTLVPLFADIRFYTLESLPCTVFSLEIGRSFATNDGTDNFQLFLNPGLGEKIHLSKKMSIDIGFGYTFQSYLYYAGYNVYYKSSVSCIKLTLGVAFD